MFVGHGLLAFALVAGGTRALGWSRERALALGALAFAFGLLPDVDMLYAPVGVLGAEGLLGAARGFWRASGLVHRGPTHSLLVGGAAAVAAGLRVRGGLDRLAGGVLLAGLVLVAALVSGALGALVMAVFVGGAAALAALGRRWLGSSPAQVVLAAAVGLLGHPFGDLFTGEPPAFLYPLDVALVATRVQLHPDPTLHLLCAMALELATAWLAVGVYLRVSGSALHAHLRTPAGLGVGYAGAAFVVPAPTLDLSYPFVFGVVSVGLVAGGLARAVDDDRTLLGVAVTGLAAVTLAAASYALAYLAGAGPGVF